MHVLLLYSILLSCMVAGRLTPETPNQHTRKVLKRNSGPIVSLPQGKVRGVRKIGEDGRRYKVFRSIPYAEPPVGPLRLKFPVPAGGWEGVRDGTKGPSPCPQYDRDIDQPIGNEDCLYLDVWAPRKASGLSVMVYIHGGYYSNGFIGYYGNGDYLVAEDVIVVMLQYRLGLLGFLSTEDANIPGNFGLRDQNLALQWVKKNIEHFGGDPSKITIFGQSAGAVSVHMHILSPYSKGLFSRAIMQSGNALNHYATRNDHADVARQVGSDLGCPGVTKDSIARDADLLTCLQAASVTQLVRLYFDYQTLVVVPLLFVPRVDGDFLPAAPEVLLRQGLFNRVNIISGVTKHEGAIFTKRVYADPLLRLGFLIGFITTGPLVFMIDDEEWFIDQQDSPLLSIMGPVVRDLLLTKWQKNMSKILFTEYVGAVTIKDESADQLTKMFTDFHFAVPHDETVQLHAAGGITKVYAYELHHRGPGSFYDDYDTTIGSHWVPHQEDLQFIFSNVSRYDPLTSNVDLKLRQMMVKMWTNFAKFGNPTPSPVNGIIWRAISSGKSRPPSLDHLILTPTPHMAQDTRCKVREFLTSLQTEQNHNLYSSIEPEAPRCYALFNS